MSPREAVLSACADILGAPVTDETKTLADLGADSLDMVEITMEVEERLLIELEDSEIGPEMTVGALIALVESVQAKLGTPTPQQPDAEAKEKP